MNHPGKDSILSRVNRAFQLLRKGRHNDAQRVFDEIICNLPDDIEVNVHFGHLCLELDEAAQAIDSFSKAVLAEPDNAIYLGFLGVAYMKNRQWHEADAVLQKALEIDPGLTEPLINLGAVNVYFGNHSEAISLLEQAARLKPSEPNIYANLAISLRLMGRYEEALKHAEKTIRLDPTIPSSYETVGRILMELGRPHEAIPRFEKALRLNRTFGHAMSGLAAARKYSAEDRAIIEKTEKTLQQSMPPVQRSYFHFSLGKMYDDLEQWHKAFEHYRQGNLLMKSAIEQKPPHSLFKQIKKNFSAKLLEQAAHFGNDSDIPVFIVGMPRSGTTLIEQIIASHPDAAGAGELLEIERISRTIFPPEAVLRNQTECRDNITEEAIKLQAAAYLDVLRKTREGAVRITDKMPENFVFLGLVSLLFPKATIIHAVRNPLDTCLSCYFQPFDEVHWAFDQVSVAKRYRFYRHVMDYWNRVLPPGKIIEVHYEKLIEDPQNQSRRIIESCGLPWDPVCLDFKKREGPVRTASAWQVRQDIYRTSKKRWENYAPYLGEVANTLGKFVDDEARDTFRKYGVKLRSSWDWGFLVKKLRA